MIESEGQGFRELLKVSTPYLAVTFVYATAVIVLEELIGDHVYKSAGQMGSVFGIAVAFFLGFRMNSAYDRWWEARKILGELNNNASSFVCKVFTYFTNSANLRETHRQQWARITQDIIAMTRLYVKELKNELLQTPDAPESDRTQLFEKHQLSLQCPKASNEILLALSVRIEEVFASERQLEKSDLMAHISRFFDIQGRAERIKNTPFLKIYSAFTLLIVILYVLLIPFFLGDIDLAGEGSRLEYLALPIMAVISSIFLTINRLANMHAEPFSDNPTSLPLRTICRGIDNNCAQVASKIVEPNA